MQRLFHPNLQMLGGMRLKARWDQGSAAASYCSTTQALCEALQAASQAVPPEIATHPQLVPLATNALLVSMALASSIHPGSTHIPSSAHAHAHSRDNSQGGGGSQGGGALHEELHEQVVVPPGCSAEGLQQLQAGLESVCQASRHLLCSCSGVLQMQMATPLILAGLSIVQCAPPGEPSCYQHWLCLLSWQEPSLVCWSVSRGHMQTHNGMATHHLGIKW